MHAKAAGVDDTLGDAFMIEMENLFAEVKIFQQRRTAFTDAQAVLVVGDRHTLLRGQHIAGRTGDLMQLPASPCPGFEFARGAFCAFVLTDLPGHAKLS
jgi:hypothetical protein